MTGIRPSKSQLTTDFEEVFSAHHLTKKYPILTGGIETGIVHWVFQSYYVILGKELGFQPITEYPFYEEGYRSIIGEDTNRNTQNHSDVSWLNPEGEIKCAIEFEKFQSNPREKARNLIHYTEQQSDLDLVILHYWDTNSQKTSHLIDDIKNELREGFDHHQPEADTVLIETAFLEGTQNGHTFTHIIDIFPQS